MREKWRTWGIAALSFVAAVAAPGDEKDPRARLHEVLDQRREAFAQVAREIWGFAEVGYPMRRGSRAGSRLSTTARTETARQ
jgi:hypothetical protein